MSDADAWERARWLIRTWNELGLDAWAAQAWSPDMVWEEDPRFPDAGTHRGREACVRRMHERFDWLGEVELELVDVQQAGGRTLMEMVVHSEGPQSGAPSSQREFLVTETEDGRTTLLLEFLDREAALSALAQS